MTGSVKDACVLIHQLGETGPEDLTRLRGELFRLEERQLELNHKLRDAAVRLRLRSCTQTRWPPSWST